LLRYLLLTYMVAGSDECGQAIIRLTINAVRAIFDRSLSLEGCFFSLNFSLPAESVFER